MNEIKDTPPLDLALSSQEQLDKEDEELPT